MVLTSEKYWGEKPSGKWILRVAMRGLNREMAKMSKFKLGTTSDSAQLIYLSSEHFCQSRKSHSRYGGSMALLGKSIVGYLVLY